MRADILTMIWKERKMLFRSQGSRGKLILSVFVPVVMIAVILPLQMGREWVDTAWSIVGAVVIPLILVGMAIPQSFAGERERHTLENLLASRLPDRAILFGKLIFAILYGWGMTIVVLALSLIPVNLLGRPGAVLFYRPRIALAAVAVGLLMAGLVASLGVLVSLRSATAQGAQQTLVSVFLIPLFALQVVPMLLMSLVPDGREILRRWLAADLTSVMLVVLAVLVVANGGALLGAMARFKRSRLILG